MREEYNSQTFTPDDVEKGLHLEFLKTLISLSEQYEDSYNDIHIYNDGMCTIIDWEKVPFSGEWGGKFEYVGEDRKLLYTLDLPDNSIMSFDTEDERYEFIQQYMKDHPEWHYTSWGEWRFTEGLKKD